MAESAKHHYVLIAGAFCGGWLWRDVAEGLRAAGHTVSTPTLSGLGERRHLGQGVDLEVHIEDVLAHIEMERLPQVTLVGASYGGMVITGVLARIPNRIRAIIYLDAFVPEDGMAMIDYLLPETQAAWEDYRETDGLLPPFSAERLGLTDPEQIAAVMPRLVPHPIETCYQPVRALKRRPAIPTAYIRCKRYRAAHCDAALDRMRKEPAVKIEAIDTGHMAMVTAPDETTQLLIKYGG